jgi:hypothetical protein
MQNRTEGLLNNKEIQKHCVCVVSEYVFVCVFYKVINAL